MTSRARRDHTTHNSTLDRTAGSHSLAAAGQRERSTPEECIGLFSRLFRSASAPHEKVRSERECVLVTLMARACQIA